MSAEDSGGLGGDRKDALARAFILDANSEWVTVATGVAVTEVGEETPTLTVSLHDEADESVLFSTTFHKDQDIARQQGKAF
jgi:acetylornithine/succinyldiaminopimelate/putrescine aminotransferase